MENLDLDRGHGQNFDHLTMVILKCRPWSWSKIFDHMTMTPGHRPNGQKIVVALPPPPPDLSFAPGEVNCSAGHVCNGGHGPTLLGWLQTRPPPEKTLNPKL